jgi:hypothetical protein
MRKVLFFVLCLVAVSFAQKEGIIGNLGMTNDEATRSAADLYTTKMYKASADGNLVVATTYPGLLCKGFYNNRRDSSVFITGISSVGDTTNWSIHPGETLWKLPIQAKFIAAACSDSIYLLMQKR